MGLLIGIGVVALAYLYATNKLTPQLLRLLGAGALGLLALRSLLTGGVQIGLLLGAGAAAVAFWGARSRPRQRATVPSLDEARDILGVAPGAGPDEIRAAHRRLVAQVHPDKGGTAYLTQRVNAARDVLLDAGNRTPPRAS